jgi:hypothetical protein
MINHDNFTRLLKKNTFSAWEDRVKNAIFEGLTAKFGKAEIRDIIRIIDDSKKDKEELAKQYDLEGIDAFLTINGKEVPLAIRKISYKPSITTVRLYRFYNHRERRTKSEMFRDKNILYIVYNSKSEKVLLAHFFDIKEAAKNKPVKTNNLDLATMGECQDYVEVPFSEIKGKMIINTIKGD